MEAFKIEKALDTRVRNGLDKTQKEIMLKEKLRFIKEELGEENNLEYDYKKYKKWYRIAQSKRFEKRPKLFFI